MSDPSSSPIEPLKDSGAQQKDLKESKASIYEIASGLESALTELLGRVEDSDKEVNEKLDKIVRRITVLEHNMAKSKISAVQNGAQTESST